MKDKVINLDALPHNQDWIKRGNWIKTQAKTKKELQELLESTNITFEQFKKMPIYKFHKDYIDNLPEE